MWLWYCLLIILVICKDVSSGCLLFARWRNKLTKIYSKHVKKEQRSWFSPWNAKFSFGFCVGEWKWAKSLIWRLGKKDKRKERCAYLQMSFWFVVQIFVYTYPSPFQDVFIISIVMNMDILQKETLKLLIVIAYRSRINKK